jgi:hypothetical protein
MAVDKQKLVDLERCNINLQVISTIRDQLEKLSPSDEQAFSTHVKDMQSKLDEIGADEISLRDTYFEEITR